MHPLIYDWNRTTETPRPSVMLDDETLRDGLQSPSVRCPSIDEKLRILQTVEKHLTAEPPEMLQAIFTDVRAFTKGAAQSDDITALVLRYGG